MRALDEAANMKLRIITTGGTMDKLYYDANSEYEVGEPQIGDILAAMSVGFEFRVQPLMRKDSLDITESDRNLIFQVVSEAPEKHILITHGTDSMVETAQVLKAVSDKVVVLTGALNPARFQGSDAVFNIGTAVAAVQMLDPGVYIAMNGRVFDADNVRKNPDANCFEEIDR